MILVQIYLGLLCGKRLIQSLEISLEVKGTPKEKIQRFLATIQTEQGVCLIFRGNTSSLKYFG